MKGAGNILRIIRPFLKGWPIIGLSLIIGAGLGYRHLFYSIPTYQAVSTLQINDKESGASAFLENFEAFSMTGLILTEVEVLRSKYLMYKTLEKLDVQTAYYRYFRENAWNLYHQNAFRVIASIEDSSWQNRHFQFFLQSDTSSLDLFYSLGEQEIHLQTHLGDSLALDGIGLRIIPEDAYGKKLIPGHYGFTIFSKAKLLSTYSNHNLQVVLLDKEISIVKLAYKHEVPELAADIVNTLAETYIEDFIQNKTQSASKVLRFINAQVEVVENDLKEAEARLASYKTTSQVVDMKLEADAKLKRITDLEVRKLNLELQETELESLLNYISGDTLDPNLAPNYGSVEDAAFTDALLQLSRLSTEREGYLQKYTVEHPEVMKLDQEITRTRKVLQRSVQNTLATVRAKMLDIAGILRQADKEFSKLPEIEKRIITLQRQKFTNEQVLSFLLEKQAEASIGAAATIAFHKILEYAPPPTMAISPQKSLIMGVSAMVGGILGLLIVFLIHYMRAGIADVKDVEDNFDIPVIGVVRKIPDDLEQVSQDFINMTTNVLLTRDTHTLSVSAWSEKHGKNAIALNLAKAFSAVGHKTLLVDLDLYQPEIHEELEIQNDIGLCQVVQGDLEPEKAIHQSAVNNLDLLSSGLFEDDIPTGIILNPNIWVVIKTLKSKYDRIIFNLPPLQTVMDAIPIMRASDMNLLSVRAGRTRFPSLRSAEKLLRSFEVPELQIAFIQREDQRQAVYNLESGSLPRIGRGARRTLFKLMVRQVLFQRNKDGSYQPMGKMGSGNRRKIIFQTIRRVLGR